MLTEAEAASRAFRHQNGHELELSSRDNPHIGRSPSHAAVSYLEGPGGGQSDGLIAPTGRDISVERHEAAFLNGQHENGIQQAAVREDVRAVLGQPFENQHRSSLVLPKVRSL